MVVVVAALKLCCLQMNRDLVFIFWKYGNIVSYEYTDSPATLPMQWTVFEGLIRTIAGGYLCAASSCSSLTPRYRWPIRFSFHVRFLKQLFSPFDCRAASRAPEGCLDSTGGPIRQPGSIFLWLTKAQSQRWPS